MFGDCDYGAQVKGIVYSHVHRVHLGVTLGCRFCPKKSWWQARYWSIHMQNIHPQEPKFEPLVLPENIKAEPVESEVLITEERFEIPTPKHLLEAKKEAQTTKRIKQELGEVQALWELAKTDKRHSYTFQSSRAHPQSAIAAIRYHKKPPMVSQAATAIVMEGLDTETEGELKDDDDKSDDPTPE